MEADPELLLAIPYGFTNVLEPGDIADAVGWWEQPTVAGGEGMGTDRDWADVMLLDDGDTATIGVVFAGAVTVTEEVPEALL